MSELEKEVARQGAKIEGAERRLGDLESADHVEPKDLDHRDNRITSLEKNQRWAILAILSLLLKGAFDFITKGGAQ